VCLLHRAGCRVRGIVTTPQCRTPTIETLDIRQQTAEVQCRTWVQTLSERALLPRCRSAATPPRSPGDGRSARMRTCWPRTSLAGQSTPHLSAPDMQRALRSSRPGDRTGRGKKRIEQEASFREGARGARGPVWVVSGVQSEGLRRRSRLVQRMRPAADGVLAAAQLEKDGLTLVLDMRQVHDEHPLGRIFRWRRRACRCLMRG
jgi:hypothetical protein